MESWQTALFIAGFIALVMVLPSLVSGTIRTRWPMKPIHREQRPHHYWVILGIWSLAAGVALLVALLEYLGS